MDVHLWIRDDDPWTPTSPWDLYQAEVVGRPEINATSRDVNQCKTLIVDAWNRVNPGGQPKTLADFEFTAPSGS